MAKDEVKEVIKSSIKKVNIKFDDALMEDLCQNLGELLSTKSLKNIFFIIVREIIEKYKNKGLSDLIYFETFLQFISEDETLQEMIVTNIDKSLMPNQAKDKTSFFIKNFNHYTSPEYIQNNSQSILTVSVFFSTLALSMTIRGLQFYGISTWKIFGIPEKT